MGLLSRILGLGRSKATPEKATGHPWGSWQSLRAKYDAAKTSDENARHWSGADYLGPRASNSPAVRRLLRSRARYEVANNSYAKGLIATLTGDAIGRGPRLQVTTGAGNKADTRVEKAFLRWSERINLAEKLRLLDESRRRDGEAFLVFVTRSNLKGRVKLDLKLIESEQCSNPYGSAFFNPQHDDGIWLDESGEPSKYVFLRAHPGEAFSGLGLAYDEVPADQVIHWFRSDRAGQTRGIPEITPALPLFAHLRRYTLATVVAAEVAATFAGVMSTNLSPEGSGDGPKIETMDRIPLERGALLTLPHGWQANQFNPTQPTNTYESFKRELLCEIGRCMDAPLNVVSGNSSQYNYSSGRLDRIIYQRRIDVDREQLCVRVLDRIFLEWLDEAMLAGELPGQYPSSDEWEWSWHFDALASIDPAKEIAGAAQALENNLTTLADQWGAAGEDWREKLEQRALEKRYAAELGLSEAATQNATSGMSVSDEPTDDETVDESTDGSSITKSSPKKADQKKAAVAGDVQAAALNGAQVTSLMAIVDRVSMKQYPADGAVALIQSAFPLIPIELINQFVDAIAEHAPPSVEPAKEKEGEEVAQ